MILAKMPDKYRQESSIMNRGLPRGVAGKHDMYQNFIVQKCHDLFGVECLTGRQMALAWLHENTSPNEDAVVIFGNSIGD